ncbi:MAG: DUF302 domain-containing protein [Xanthobacteraceae bacterium]
MSGRGAPIWSRRGVPVAAIIGIWFWVACAMAADGLITVASNFGPEETADRLESEITARGMTVFARIDHAAGAAQVGMALRPTQVLIFGNAKGGTPLMQSDQTVGIDLPLKVLVWEDADGKTWLSYNDPKWIAQRHGLGADADRVIDNLSAALKAVVRAATERP